ncbi:PAAR domain-containing protein [Streptomyces sp. M19]
MPDRAARPPERGERDRARPGRSRRGTVLIGGLPVARMGDKTTCGAQIVMGAFDVQIGGVL